MSWVILIQLNSTTMVSEASATRYKFPPLGLLYISSMLRVHGYNVEIIDLLSFNESFLFFKKKLNKLKKKHVKDPLLVGFSVFTENAEDAFYYAEFVRKIFKKSLIVFGGAHAKAEYYSILLSNKVDIVSMVEGEGNIIELCEYKKGLIKRNKIRGIAYKDKERIIVNENFYIKDLDELPFPDFLNINYFKYRDVGIIVTSRGCPGECIFCASRAFSGSKYRAYSAERIYAEMIFLNKNFGIVDFGFMDDTFTALKSRTFKFCKLLKRMSKEIFSYSIKSRVDLLNVETLQYLKQTNCDSIHIGVESADDNVLKSLKKRTTLEKNLWAIEKISEFGITPECSFIIGNPNDSIDTIYKTILFVYLLNKHYKPIKPATFGISTPYPGTELSNKRKELGIKLIIKDWRRYDCTQPIFETKNFTLSFLRKTIWEYETNKKNFIKNILKKNEKLKTFYMELEKRIKKAARKYKDNRERINE